MTIINLSQRYIFINNHQTGSEIIEQYQHKYNSENPTQNYIYLKSFGPGQNYTSVKKYLDSRQIDINDFYIFGFIQHPITRVESCYQYEHEQGFSNVSQLGQNSRDFNFYIQHDLNLSFFGIESVFFDQHNRLPKNVHIFKIEDLSMVWNQISGIMGLNGVRVQQFPVPVKRRYSVKTPSIALLRKRYPLDWGEYFE